MESSFYKRVNKEWCHMLTNPLPGVSYGPFADGWRSMEGIIEGQKSTVYEGGVFCISIILPQQYPFRPPKMKFLTKIYHPNIDRYGFISIDVLAEKWAPALTVQKVLWCILMMLSDPNPDDPMEPEIARIYKTHRELFNKTAREWTELYAM